MRTEENDVLHIGEFSEQATTFGIINVSMHRKYDLKKATEVVKTYIELLKAPFGVDYSTSTATEAHPQAASISNNSSVVTVYWQDNNGIDWKIKGYTDGKIASVLYVKNISATTVQDHDLFLDSFRFPQSS